MDDVVTQLGLLLTQTRFARRALEDIERATARYGSFAVTAAVGAAGTGLTAPPLLDGALRVHVVNINDLAPGSSDTITGLLGGIGSFVGNLFGGAVGGTIGSITLAESLGTINTLVERIERIITKLGIGQGATQPAEATAQAAASAHAGASGAGAAATPAAAGGQMEFVAMLKSVQGKFDTVTALLQAANGTPPGPGAAPTALDAPDAGRYRGWLDSLTAALETGTRLVGGLVAAIPTAIAALSWLLDRLPDLRNAITETLQFIVRNVLVLRGAVLVLAFETIAMVARVAAMAVRLLAAAVNEALAALFAALAKLLDAALELGKVLGNALKDTIDKLLTWLVPTVYNVLWKLGELRLFYVVEQLIKGISAIGKVFEKGGAGQKAAEATGQSSQEPLKVPPPPPPPPDLNAIITKAAADAKAATDKLTGSSKELVDKPTTALRKSLSDFGKSMDEAAIKEAHLTDTNLADRLKTIGDKSTEAAQKLLPATAGKGQQNVWDRLRAQTPFHPIAAAYGQWLASGGLTQLLDSMSTYFATPAAQATPATPGGAEPAAVVEIGEVIIDLTPAGAPVPAREPEGNASGPAEFPILGGHDAERLDRRDRLDAVRGIRGQRRPHVPIFDFTP